MNRVKEQEMLNMLTKEEQDYYLGCDFHHNEEIWQAGDGNPATVATLVKSWYADRPTDEE